MFKLIRNLIFLGFSLFVLYLYLPKPIPGLPQNLQQIDIKKIIQVKKNPSITPDEKTSTPDNTSSEKTALTTDTLVNLTDQDKVKVLFETQPPVTFHLTVARSTKKKNVGLMYIDSLPAYEGMFFIFDDSVKYPFWMKNVEIPLDMIFINKNLEIVYIQHSAKPCKVAKCPYYGPEKEYQFVVEINGNKAKEFNINNSTKLKIFQEKPVKE